MAIEDARKKLEAHVHLVLERDDHDHDYGRGYLGGLRGVLWVLGQSGIAWAATLADRIAAALARRDSGSAMVTRTPTAREATPMRVSFRAAQTRVRRVVLRRDLTFIRKQMPAADTLDRDAASVADTNVLRNGGGDDRKAAVRLPTPLPPMLTVRQMQQFLGIGRRQVYDLVHAGVIPVVRLGQRRLGIEREALLKWIRAGGLNKNTARE